MMKITAHILFFILCIAVALVYRFPSEAAGSLINERLAKMDHRLSCDLDGLAPSLTLGVKADHMVVNWNHTPIMEWTSPRARLNLSALLGGRREASYEGQLLGGTIFGDICFKGSRPMDLTAHMENLSPDNLDLSPGLRGYKLTGIIQGALTAHLLPPKTLGAQLTATPLMVTFPAPIYGIDQIKFSKGELGLIPHDDGSLHLQTCRFTGPEMDVEARGKLVPKTPIRQTEVNLRLTLRLHPLFFMDAGTAAPPELKKTPAFHLAVKGSLAHPQISMDRGSK